MRKNYFVYILTNKKHTVLYIGITNNLLRRFGEHVNKINKNSFTYKYNVDKLVYYECYNDVIQAILREKYLKGILRSKKISLINSMNPDWVDLSCEL